MHLRFCTMALHCYVIPQAVARGTAQLVRRITHAPVGIRHIAVRSPARVPHALNPSDACSAPIQALRAMRSLAGLPGAALVAGGMALGAAGAGVGSAPAGGPGAGVYPGGSGRAAAATSIRPATVQQVSNIAAGNDAARTFSDTPSSPQLLFNSAPDGSRNLSPDIAPMSKPGLDAPVSVPEPAGAGGIGFAAALAAAAWARRQVHRKS